MDLMIYYNYFNLKKKLKKISKYLQIRFNKYQIFTVVFINKEANRQNFIQDG